MGFFSPEEVKKRSQAAKTSLDLAARAKQQGTLKKLATPAKLEEATKSPSMLAQKHVRDIWTAHNHYGTTQMQLAKQYNIPREHVVKITNATSSTQAYTRYKMLHKPMEESTDALIEHMEASEGPIADMISLVAGQQFSDATSVLSGVLNNRVTFTLDEYKKDVAQNMFVPALQEEHDDDDECECDDHDEEEEEEDKKKKLNEARYGMFSADGGKKVHAIVQHARKTGKGYEHARAALDTLAKDKKYAEAMDTAVRENVYAALRKKD